MSIIDQIKTATPIADLIAETYTVTGRGRVLTTVEHDSLKIWTDTNTWYWFSQATGGDCLDWIQHVYRFSLGDAIDYLATRANIERRPPTPEEAQQRTNEQQRRRILQIAADHYHSLLLEHPNAEKHRLYCTYRGWNSETIASERIGCILPANLPISQSPNLPSPSDNIALSLDAKLRAENLLHHPAARAVLSIPPDMIVYTHRRGGQVTALSARSITGKRHYHLPDEPTPIYENSAHRRGYCLLVEGQADAISLAQLGIPAIALCGLGGEDLSPIVERITHIALDADDAGRDRAVNIAAQIGPMLPIVEWQPIAGQPVKDANDALRAGLSAADLWLLLENAQPALLHMASNTRRLTGDLRTEAQRRVLDAFLSLDDLVQADIKPKLADALNVGIAQINRLIKAREEERNAEEAEDTKDNPNRYEHSAGAYVGGVLFEQCVQWRPDGSAYCVYAIRWPNGAIDMRPFVDVGGVTYTPYPPHIGLINKEIVLFPEMPVAYPDQRSLLRDVQAFIHKYLDVDPFYERLAAYYVMFSWLYDLFATLPYLRALGDYGTGKSRFLQTIGVLCYRPMFMGGATTVSPVFRIIELMRGTLIMDEADFSNSDTDNELIKIINLGYDRKQGFAFRNDKQGDDHWPEPYNVYGPKILATRKEFVDKATESRCLTKRMSAARPRPGIPYVLDDDFWLEARALRNKLLMHRFRNHRPIPLDNSMAEETIEPRLNQVMMALKATIDDPSMKEELTAFMVAYNQQLIGKRGMQLPALVLQAVVDIFFGSTDLLGERDFSMQAIADRAQTLVNEWDPNERISARRITDVLNDDLGLTERDKITSGQFKGRRMLKVTEEDLRGLMSRWGVTPTETPPKTR